MRSPPHPTIEERQSLGKAARKQVPHSSHAEWSPPSDRPDPVDLLESQTEGRLDWLIPLRRGRMKASPFAFYRGAAKVMAADLANTPVSGLTVQACGDAHLSNFGFFASPERELVFDLNDFDETLAGPWEWDVKRLAASVTIAARHNAIERSECRTIAEHTVSSYRTAMARFANMRTMDVWYSLITPEYIEKHASNKSSRLRVAKIVDKAKTKDSLQAFGKLAEEVDGKYRIKSQPPLLVPLRELRKGMPRTEIQRFVEECFESYQMSLEDRYKSLLRNFRPIDIAIKVVGVGSVGMRCSIMLLEGRDRSDPLFLQLKEATRSVLEEHLTLSPYDNQGQRVVEGQRLMQTVSDSFLGWSRSESTGRDYYWRQLRDWKGSANVDKMEADNLYFYAETCGWALANAHARSGDPVAIASYLGTDDRFDKAIAEFSECYARQNDRDYEAFLNEIRSGRLAIEEE